MIDALRKRLAFHGAAVIMLGMLSGMPLAAVMLGYMPGNPDDWKLSHMEGLTNGLLILAVAGIAGLLTLSAKNQKLLYWTIAFTGYSNALYGWVRGFSGQAGLDFAPPISNQIAALLAGLQIITALIAITLVMIGACKTCNND